MTNGNGAPPPEGQPPQLNVLAQYIKDFSFENPNAPASLQPSQTQEDEHREAKKDDGSDFHVASVRLSIAGSAGPVLLSI